MNIKPISQSERNLGGMDEHKAALIYESWVDYPNLIILRKKVHH